MINRKQGIIHLGHNKSPGSLRTNSRSKSKAVQSVKTSRTNQPLVENIHLNNSMHISASPSMKIKSNNLSNTHPGFFPPSPREVQQFVVKQNIRPVQKTTIVQHSPLKRVVVSRPITIVGQHSPNKLNQSLHSQSHPIQQENQLQRKIKVLENRIQQLHQQKQVTLVRSHEQNKKLGFDNAMLRNKLIQVQNVKGNQIMNLKQEIANLRAHQMHSQRIAQAEPTLKPNLVLQKDQPSRAIEPKQTSSPINNKSLRNIAYIQQEEKINNQTYKQQLQEQNNTITKAQSQTLDKKYSILENQNINLLNKVKSLQQQNTRLNLQITQLKETLLQNSGIIQQNNKKIITNYENKINLLCQELKNYKQTNNSQWALKDKLQYANQQNQQYVQRFLNKSQELMKLQESYKQKINQLNKQNEEYVQRVISKSQQLMKLQDDYKEKLKNLQSQNQKSKQFNIKNQQKIKLMGQKILQLQTNTQNNVSDKNKQENIVESCQKCKQLIKTLVKLNQKAFSKTM